MLNFPGFISEATGQGISAASSVDFVFKSLVPSFLKDINVSDPTPRNLGHFVQSMPNSRTGFGGWIGNDDALSIFEHPESSDFSVLKIFEIFFGAQSVMHGLVNSCSAPRITYTEVESKPQVVFINQQSISRPEIGSLQNFIRFFCSINRSFQLSTLIPADSYQKRSNNNQQFSEGRQSSRVRSDQTFVFVSQVVLGLAGCFIMLRGFIADNNGRRLPWGCLGIVGGGQIRCARGSIN